MIVSYDNIFDAIVDLLSRAARYNADPYRMMCTIIAMSPEVKRRMKIIIWRGPRRQPRGRATARGISATSSYLDRI